MPQRNLQKTLFPLLLAILLLSGCTTKTDDVIKLTLDNGLRAVIVRNDLAPAVSIQMNYLVGSNDSPSGFPGTAHAVEHIMFRGSPGLSGDQLAAINAALGGIANAETDETGTRYVSTVPAENLETALHVEALRMAELDADEAAWNIERGALEQEVLQNLSEPSYHLFSRIQAHLFKGTPYEHDALGSTESFARTNGAMLKKFHADWYGPNNAVLVIAGNVDPKAAAAMVHTLFSPIPTRPLAKRLTVSPQPTEALNLELESNYDTGLAVVALRLPGADSPDYAALQVLADIIDSPCAALNELTMNGTLLGASFDLYVSPHLSAGYVSAPFAPGEDGSKLVSVLKETIAGYARNGVPAEMVAAAQKRAITGFAFQATSLEDQAVAWSDALVLERVASPDALLKAIRKVTVTDVNRVAKQYLNGDSAVTAVMTPRSSSRAARMARDRQVRDSFAPEGVPPVALPTWARVGVMTEPAEPTASRPVDVKLANGLRVIVKPTGSGKGVALYGYVTNNPDLQTPVGKDGVADFLEMIFGYGTAHLNWQAYEKAQTEIGAAIDLGTGFSMAVTSQHFDRAVPLLADGILHPNFSTGAFNIIRNKAVLLSKNSHKSPGHLAQRAMLEALHEKNSPLLRRTTPATVAALTLTDLQEYHKAVFRPDMTTIVIIGNISAKDAVAAIEKHFGRWQSHGAKPETDYQLVAPNGRAVIVVPDKQRVQDEVTLKETIALARANPDYYPLQLGMALLSGGFYATRLNTELREKRGLVYAVDAALSSYKSWSELEITFGTSMKHVATVRGVIKGILENTATVPASFAELEQAKQMLLNQMMLGKTSYDGIAAELFGCILLELPLDEPQRAAAAYRGMTPTQVQTAFAQWIRPDGFVQVTRGGHGTRDTIPGW